MLTQDELDVLAHAEKINNKKRQFEKENELKKKENKKRRMYDYELNRLLELKQKCFDNIENVDKAMEEYKKAYIRGEKNEIHKLEKQIEKLGEYSGQCLHKEKKMCRYPNFNCYDGYEEYYVCATCDKKL